MLHKRFKVAKCKTSLKLASARIKVLKNMKGTQINQIKKDLAQLLESGQDRTARIRVEHAIREEKLVAAYELIEIYCELIVARLPIIESQKTCPIDLKEAITSVIFAAPRCSDITELQDIQKHFTAKYGKDFVSGAIELRPDCGVSRMLVEKLSAIAPDVQTKMKVLSAVAKEYNINWDPTSFEEKESKPPDDLLNGPTNFEKASAELPKVSTSKVQNVHSHEENPKAPVDFSQQNKRYTVATDNIPTPSASTTHDDTRFSGISPERMNVSHSFHSNGNNSSSHRENWPMEFKDATSAAQAAAESAERASIAARAAAQLSRQYSTESHNKTPHHFKDSYNNSFNNQNPNIQNQQTRPNEEHETKRPSKPASSRPRNDSDDESPVNNIHLADGYVKRSSYEDQGHSSPEMSKKNKSKPRVRSGENESLKTANVDYFAEDVIKRQKSTKNESKPGFRSGETENESSKSANVDYNVEDVSRRQKSTKNESKPGFRSGETENESSKSKSENVDYYVEAVIRRKKSTKNESKPGFRSGENENKSSKSAKSDYFVKDIFKKQPSISPTHSRSSSSTISDESSSGRQKSVKKTVIGNPFAVIDNKNVFQETTNPHRDDEADSDDGPRFDTGFEYDEGEAKSFFPIPGGVSVNPLENTHIWSPERNTIDTSHIFSEKRSLSVHSTKSEDPSVNFDASDGPDSENETSSPRKQDVFEVKSRKSRIELTDLVENKTELSFSKRLDEEKRIKSRQSSNVSLKNELEKDNSDDDSDTGNDLKFGKLTGGLRNKGGLKYPPYTKTVTTDASLEKLAEEREIPAKVDRMSHRSSFGSKMSKLENKKPSSELDSDDYNDKFPVDSSKTRSRFAPPDTFFNDDSEEEASPVTKPPTSRLNLGLGVSRRTKGNVEPMGKTVISSSNEPTRPEPRVPESSEQKQKPDRRYYNNETRPKTRVPDPPEQKPDRRYYNNETRPEPRPETRVPEPSEQKPVSRYHSNKTWTDTRPETRVPESPEQKPDRRYYNNETRPDLESSKREDLRKKPEPEISNPPKKITESRKPEASKTSNLSSETSSGANNVKKPSHVHPKLPEYDSLVQSLQTNRH